MSDRMRRWGGTVVAAIALVAGAPLPAVAAPDPLVAPVTVTLQALEPHDVAADSTIRVTAVLKNTSARSTGPLVLRLRRGSVLDTRGELQAADTTVPGTGAVSAPPQEVPAGLDPGTSLTVRYETAAAALGLTAGSATGVYPIALTVQRASDLIELGRLSTLLPHLDPGISGTRVTLLWPLLDRPHRLTGTAPGKPEIFADDALAKSVAAGGRLNTLLGAAESVTGRVRLTLVVDPETIEALDRMRSPAGYRVSTGGRQVPGQGGAAAAAWLDRLKAIAPEHRLVATPYADPDLVALERGGDEALGRIQEPDLTATGRVLGVRPTTQVAWPPDGQLTDSALDDVVAQGASAVVLDPTALTGSATAGAGRTPSGVSPLPALSGQAVALVSDPVVQSILQRGGLKKGGFPGGPRLAEQRLLAELAMITAEAPNDTRTLVLAPPRRWDPPVAYARAVAADLAKLPWLTSVDALDAAAGTPPVDRGELVYPADARRRELSAKQLTAIGSVQSQVADFRGALSNEDAATELGPYGDAVRRAASSAWRTAVPSGQAYVDRLQRLIGTLRGSVTVSTSATGDYTLASSDSPLLLTVENTLLVPVNVRIRIVTPAGFETHDVGVQQIPPRGKRSVQVPASVQRTGTFAVQVQATTPTGGNLGRDVTLSVRSTAYGGLALGITGLAFAVLVLAVLLRLYRRWRARGEQPPVGAGGPADRIGG
ncbi:MAG TPA: DUF6049 family protein [Mycobacteriales bacterium]|nr:DUF6049 family protein [Mycobacteriales bacterium]